MRMDGLQRECRHIKCDLAEIHVVRAALSRGGCSSCPQGALSTLPKNSITTRADHEEPEEASWPGAWEAGSQVMVELPTPHEARNMAHHAVDDVATRAAVQEAAGAENNTLEASGSEVCVDDVDDGN